MNKKVISTLVVILIGSLLNAEDVKKDKTSMFPKAKDGFTKYVIEVPKIDDDSKHRVELIIGKEILVDCNMHSLRGEIENITLKGWGYTYIEVSNIASGPSTQMGCKEPKSQKFVSVYLGDEALRRYNSHMPIVAYIPDGYELRYRIWNAQNEIKVAKK